MQIVGYMPKVAIHSLPNGPNEVLVDGRPVAYLCRCGGSGRKPHCDGTHKRLGFQAAEAFVEIL